MNEVTSEVSDPSGAPGDAAEESERSQADSGDRPTAVSTTPVEQGSEALELATARIMEYFDRRTGWHRSLWHASSALLLRETAEHMEMVREGSVPSETGLQYSKATCRAQIEKDLGISDSLRSEIEAALSTDCKKDGEAAHRLEYLAGRVSAVYVERWAEASSEIGLEGFERAARSIASHLLDAGLSPDFCFAHFRDGLSDDVPLAELIDRADRKAKGQPSQFSVLVPCTRLPSAVEHGADYRRVEVGDTESWLVENGFVHGTSAPARAGALAIEATAHDPWAAAVIAHERAQRLRARSVLAFETDQIELAGALFVDGTRIDIDTIESRRRVRVPALRGSFGAASNNLDDVMELLAELEWGTRGAAITSGWAALEGLLLLPGERDRHKAADRMADIVACSFPAAELRSLADAHRSHSDDALAARLNSTHTATARSRILERSIREERAIAGGLGDRAALQRVKQMIAEPGTLLRVRDYVTQALRRLYTQRNLVAHAGSFQSAALDTTLRSVPALVSAGMDRIVFAANHWPEAPSPLQLHTRAALELRLAATESARPLHSLLG